MIDYLLVHGGFHGAWCWERVIPYLKRDSRVGRVVAVDLVGHGLRHNEKAQDLITLEEYIRDQVAVIERMNMRDVVMVGHSLAGASMPQAASRMAERIQRLVFVSALILPEGQSAVQTATGGERSTVGAKVWSAQDFRQKFGNDMDEETIRWVLKKLGPEPPAVMVTPVTRKGFPAIMPATYVVLTKDETLAPEVQRQLARNIGNPELVELDAGHGAMISRPAYLAKILLRYA